ncbi:MAG TPA: Asp23/Gls24 family envelope stress response protein [Clostridiales bacterium]|nr:Asp23/Gls24 family envelope stress response protein [Clostridiales bacterium]HBR07749.1 Asp23/Gls24 family envelope stress response protein [Clostridiales bacterium]
MVRIENPNGVISITDDVFLNLAGDAATSCFGVKGMAGRAKDGGFFALRRESMSKGVTVSMEDDGSVSLRLHIAVDHGVNIYALCRSIIGEVSYKVSQATGVPVKWVDVYVDTILID